MLYCPFCKDGETAVIDSRDAGKFVCRRRRRCLSCKKRFTTYERIEDTPLSPLSTLLSEYINILNNHGADSEAEEQFLHQHSANKRLMSLARVSKRVKEALDGDE